MNPYVLFLSVTGHDERSGWSAILVEPEGLFEEHQGVASSPDRALLWALRATLLSVPNREQLAIRTCDRHVLKWGEWLCTSEKDRDHLPHQDLLSVLLPKLSTLELTWFDATPYGEAGDSRAKSLAKEAFSTYTFSFPEEEIIYLTELLSAPIEAPAPPETAPEQPEPTSESEAPASSHITEETPAAPAEPKLLEEAAAQPPSEPPVLLTSASLPIPEAAEYLFGARILAYVDGIGAANLGAWSLLLIDRQTRTALLRAEGVRSTTPHQMRLHAAIEALLALKTENQSIEIRCRARSFISLGNSWMHRWKAQEWTRIGKEPIKALPFVQQLYELSLQHRTSWHHIPEASDEQGIKEAKILSKKALQRLNYGEKASIEERRRNYPINLLL
jgi:ribonuclease HI